MQSEKTNETFKCSLNIMNAKLATLSSIGQKINDHLNPFFEIHNSFTIWSGNFVLNLNDLNYSIEERKQKMVSYIIWGEYGWTPIPTADYFLFDTPPIDQSDSNKIAMAHFNKSNLCKFFELLLGIKGVKKADVIEAIKCFENKCYKACALILFSLIDAKLIHLQPTKEINQNRSRKPGKNGMCELKNYVENSETHTMFFEILTINNLYSCCSKFFERGNDFSIPLTTINRNFLSHGMYTKKVLKRECIQIFLLYYNLLLFIDTFDITKHRVCNYIMRK